MAAKHRGLGRGLNALIKEVPVEPEAAATPSEEGAAEAAEAPVAGEPIGQGGVAYVDLTDIVENPWQPRNHFADEALEDLTASIKEHGILQPLLVRKAEKGYQLIAGERRMRASKAAKLQQVPVIIRDMEDQTALEIALIENLQRQDLNAIEEAEGYHALMQEFGLTQENVAERVGKGRATIANTLRLLQLTDYSRDLLAQNKLTQGHAKALLGLDIPAEQDKLARRAVQDGLSVRAVEEMVSGTKKPAPKKPREDHSDIPGDHLRYLTEELQQHLGTGVKIQPSRSMPNGNKVAGKLVVDFYSADDLSRVVDIIGLKEEL